MRKLILLISLGFGLMSMISPVTALAGPQCFWASNMKRAYCPPPFGDIVRDVNAPDKYLCGLGQCVMNVAGKYRCSSVVGGAAVIDSRNRAACVGGCVEASEALCVKPEP